MSGVIGTAAFAGGAEGLAGIAGQHRVEGAAEGAGEELFATAAAMGIDALAVTDRNTLAGIVRAHEAAKEAGVQLIVGCRLDLACGMSVLVYPTDRAVYSRLCRLLSLGKPRKTTATRQDESTPTPAAFPAWTAPVVEYRQHRQSGLREFRSCWEVSRDGAATGVDLAASRTGGAAAQ
nr:PHP domain-containing protein [Paracoccus pantotrophus]